MGQPLQAHRQQADHRRDHSDASAAARPAARKTPAISPSAASSRQRASDSSRICWPTFRRACPSFWHSAATQPVVNLASDLQVLPRLSRWNAHSPSWGQVELTNSSSRIGMRVHHFNAADSVFKDDDPSVFGPRPSDDRGWAWQRYRCPLPSRRQAVCRLFHVAFPAVDVGSPVALRGAPGQTRDAGLGHLPFRLPPQAGSPQKRGPRSPGSRRRSLFGDPTPTAGGTEP